MVCVMSLSFGVLIAKEKKEDNLRARIDVAGGDVVNMLPGKASNGCHVENITWGNGETNYFVITCETEKLSFKKWHKFTFSFIPQESGQVSIDLMSNYSNGGEGQINAHWIYYDDITVKGGKLINGSFDKIMNNFPRGWSGLPKNLVKKASKFRPPSGSYVVKAWHNARVRQVIKVKEKEKVTITFKAMACEFVPAYKLED